MKVLIVGSGGREHALSWKIAQSDLVDSVIAAPGSAAMAKLATCHADVSSGDIAAVLSLAQAEQVDLVVIGPEDPLAAGMADRLRAVGIDTFGPSAAAAQLEGSKAFAKDFMQRHGIPTAAHATFDELEAAVSYVREHVPEQGGGCVVKADGLAAGKGVAMCEGPKEAEQALREMMGDRRFGDAGRRVVIEEWLQGEEASYYAVSDGENIITLAAAQDHKRAFDGDTGENTGGMGAYSPAPVISEIVEKKVLEQIVHPTIRGMAADGHPFAGVLFVGLMIDGAGDPRVIEFNVRFGDPETQALLARMEGDIVPMLLGSARGALGTSADVAWGESAVCVVMASKGYPRAYETGFAIRGIDEAERDPDVIVFHAGSQAAPDAGSEDRFVTKGGRVLGVTARGASVEEARDRAYAAARKIEFDGAFYRSDIAARALGRPDDGAPAARVR